MSTPRMIFRRRNTRRCRSHSYSGDGMYHLTLRSAVMENLFGMVTQAGVVLNEYGRIAHEELLRTEQIRQELSILRFVIMPNHIHLLVVLKRSTDFSLSNSRTKVSGSAYNRRRSTHSGTGPHPRSTAGPPPRSLGSFVAGYKSIITRRIREISGQSGAVIWQRNYDDRIVRSHRMKQIVCGYIQRNPQREWIRLQQHQIP